MKNENVKSTKTKSLLMQHQEDGEVRQEGVTGGARTHAAGEV